MVTTAVAFLASLMMWYSGLVDDRAATVTLVAVGFTPNELASAGITPSEIQAAMTILAVDGISVRLEQAVSEHDTTIKSLSAAQNEYLKTRSDESSQLLVLAKRSESANRQEVDAAREAVKACVRSCISDSSGDAIERCLSASHLDLPLSCKFVDPSEVRPKELAVAVHSMHRAIRHGNAPDPDVRQLISVATTSSEVRDAETSLVAYGAALRAIYDTNLDD